MSKEPMVKIVVGGKVVVSDKPAKMEDWRPIMHVKFGKKETTVTFGKPKKDNP